MVKFLLRFGEKRKPFERSNNMNRKKRQLVASIIVIILVFAMILPMLAYIL